MERKNREVSGRLSYETRPLANGDSWTSKPEINQVLVNQVSIAGCVTGDQNATECDV